MPPGISAVFFITRSLWFASATIESRCNRDTTILYRIHCEHESNQYYPAGPFYRIPGDAIKNPWGLSHGPASYCSTAFCASFLLPGHTATTHLRSCQRDCTSHRPAPRRLNLKTTGLQQGTRIFIAIHRVSHARDPV